MLTIESPQPADRRDWERLFRAYMEFYERTVPDRVYERAWRRFQDDREIHARVARQDGRLVGLAHFLRHAQTDGQDVCYLQDLFTDPAARGQGVARALIEHVAAWARTGGCGALYWQTHVTNARARRLYDRMAAHRGFIVYELDL